MVTIAVSPLGEMAPASRSVVEQAEESFRQNQIAEALNHLQQEAIAINNAIAAVQPNAQVAQMEQQIQSLPGKFSQPVGQIAALNARRDEIASITDQLKGERNVPGAKAGLSRYGANIGTLYGPPPETINPPEQYQNISLPSAPAAPQTVAQQEATRQSFNVMDDAIRSAETQPGFDNTMDSTAGSAAAPGLAPSNVGNFAAPGLAEAQVTPNELSAMSMVANQAAAEAFSNAIAANATVAEATAAAEEAAQTAAQHKRAR